MTDLPLRGLGVLDLTVYRAGPTAVRQLADWGADVIKIEPPGEAKGDVLGGNRHGFDFQNLHRNKRGIRSISTRGRARLFLKLVKAGRHPRRKFPPRCEVSPKIFDYDILAVNPRLIYGSISGFGQSGPDAPPPGVDQIAQGLGGFMSVTGLPGQGPGRVGIPISDLTSGLFLSQACPRRPSEASRPAAASGAHIPAGGADPHAGLPGFALADRPRRKQAGNDHPTRPHGRVPDRRWHVNIAASGQGLWERFCKAIGWKKIALAIPDFTPSGGLRSKNRKVLNERIGAITRLKGRVHVLAGSHQQGRCAVWSDQRHRRACLPSRKSSTWRLPARWPIPSSATSRWSASRST